MSNIFLCSDHHFSHLGMLKFFRADGVTPLRVFDSVEEMDEYIIYRHNRVVNDDDRVYFIGDVAFNKKALSKVARLKGRKVLIKGNHDIEKLSEYVKYFDDVRGVHQFDGMILSHIPVHPESLYRWKINVHGHLHSNRVMLNGEIDPRYVSVCMEQLDDYTPISLEELKQANKSALERDPKL